MFRSEWGIVLVMMAVREGLAGALGRRQKDEDYENIDYENDMCEVGFHMSEFIPLKEREGGRGADIMGMCRCDCEGYVVYPRGICEVQDGGGDYQGSEYVSHHPHPRAFH